jgi:hypothetical protein
MPSDNVVDLHPEIDDDATQWQSEEERNRLLDQEIGDDDTTLIDTTLGLIESSLRHRSFWRWAFG